MKVNVEKKQTNLVTLEIEVEEPQVEAALERAYRQVVKKVDIPGFRKGKAPRQILEAYVGQAALYEEAIDGLVNQTYAEALEDFDFEVVGQPQIELVQMDPGMPLIYKATISIIPEIELPTYTGREIEEIVPEKPTDEEVQNVLDSYQKRMASLVVVKDSPLDNGHIAQIDFTGYLDGVPFEGGASQDYALEIGSNTFIPGFEEQLIGMRPGEERDIDVTFPEEYPQPDLAGKSSIFKVTLKEIKRKEYPVFDDEFAKDISEFETLEALKENIAKDLFEKAQNVAKQELRDKIVEDYVASVEIDVPGPLVEERLKEMITKFAQQLGMQGTTLEQYMQYTGKNAEALFAEFRPQAAEWAKTTLVLEAIAREEDIHVTDEDVEERITQASQEYGMDREDVSKSVENVMDTFKKEILLDKTVNFLLDHAKETPAGEA